MQRAAHFRIQPPAGDQDPVGRIHVQVQVHDQPLRGGRLRRCPVAFDIQHRNFRRHTTGNADVRTIQMDGAVHVQLLTRGPGDLHVGIEICGQDIAGDRLCVPGRDLHVHRNLRLQHADGALDGDIAGSRPRAEFRDAQHALLAGQLTVDIRQCDALGVVPGAAIEELHRTGDLRLRGRASHDGADRHHSRDVPAADL